MRVRPFMYGLVFLIGIYLIIYNISKLDGRKAEQMVTWRMGSSANTLSMTMNSTFTSKALKGDISYIVNNTHHPQNGTIRYEQVTNTTTNKTTRWTHVNVNEFTHLMSPTNICHSKPVFLVSLVTSAPSHRQRRAMVRSTWGSVKEVDGMRVVTLFLLARSEYIYKFESEFNEYQDMVLFDFKDDYLNLTLKTLMGLKWATKYCPNADFILKTDDDMFINYLTLVRSLVTSYGNDTAIGLKSKHSPVVRDPGSKWYTSVEVYPDERYPPYLVGVAYVIPTDIARSVVSISPQIPYIDWEDVFVGMCLNNLNITLRRDRRFDYWQRFINPTTDIPCPLHYVFCTYDHELPVNDALRALWERFLAEKQLRICQRLFRLK